MISLRQYARHRGVTLSAVRTAIDSGRLVESVTLDAHGKRKIRDVELADREWYANTLPRADQPSTRPPVPRQDWPAWVPEWLRDFEPTRHELLASDIKHHVLARALVAMQLEAPEPEAALDAFLARLEPHLPPLDEVPGMSFPDLARMLLQEHLNPEGEPGEHA